MVALLALASVPAFAQYRPIEVESPIPIGEGRLAVESSVEWQKDTEFPASGLVGDRWRLPSARVTFGLGTVGELQLEGGAHFLSIDERRPGPLASRVAPGTSASSVADLVIATKVQAMAEKPGRPALGVRFATKLPNASEQSGMALDTTDFYASLLAGKSVGRAYVVGNVGLAILGAPPSVLTPDDSAQNDLLTWGASVSWTMSPRAAPFLDAAGRVHTAGHRAPDGTETRGLGRVGVRWTLGRTRVESALLTGLTPLDTTFGVSVSARWVFDAFGRP